MFSETASPSRPPGFPCRAGIGLRTAHIEEVLDSSPVVPWFEVHSENFFALGGQPLQQLLAVRSNYPISLHGVGMSLGSTDPLSERHLDKLARLIDLVEPGLVSEHLCWSSVSGDHANDLLPLPYTEEALAHMVRRVTAVQERLGRPILVENVSSYVQFECSTIPEWEFLATLAKKAGCGILLDVNNIYVNAVNHGFDTSEYLDAIPSQYVGEIHLAGFEDTGDCLVDTHGRPVAPPVWQLYRNTLERFGPMPTLIEWDTNIPPLATLLKEARHATRMLESCHEDAS